MPPTQKLAYIVGIFMGLAIVFLKWQNTFLFMQSSATTPFHVAYFDGFNETDARVRKCGTTCMADYTNHLRDPLYKEWRHLIEMTNDIDRLSPVLASIPWKFKIFDGHIESMYPHTHGDTIYIHVSKIFETSKETLLHEKIHVYQRMYPCETHELILHGWGFSFRGMRYKHDNLRSNPDINRVLYADDHGSPILNTYKPHANNLSDIVDSRDHPYELMAYALSDVGLYTFPNIPLHRVPGLSDQHYQALTEWVKKYLTIL